MFRKSNVLMAAMPIQEKSGEQCEALILSITNLLYNCITIRSQLFIFEPTGKSNKHIFKIFNFGVKYKRPRVSRF